MLNNRTRAQIVAWLITSVSILLAIIVWGRSLSWHIFGTSTYLLFPIFGLIAFSLLWSQYIILAIRQFFKWDNSTLTNYFRISGWLVLLAILLHPGLLIWQLWRDGAGPPPDSVYHYVLPSLRFAVILGMISLTILLLFELRRFFVKHPWWHYFTYLVDLVVLLIFVHGLKLGTQLQTGWYRKVWFFYGVSYVIALIYIYRNRYLRNKNKT